MTTSNTVLTQKIAERLRGITANDLQALAEDMAAITCPNMFLGQALVRQGRTINGQTSKNWPDAYVFTASDAVNGIEATRDQQSWTKHLDADLKKAMDPDNLNLSGYFFVAGYPEHDPPEAEIQTWTQKFIDLGIPAGNVQLLVGKHLAMELVDPKYARIRQRHLQIDSSPVHFEELRESVLRKSSGVLDSPSEQEFLNGTAYKPALADAVVSALLTLSGCVVRGHGACGKTTLVHWIGFVPALANVPIYTMDLSAWADDLPLGTVKNEMTDLSGKDVIFVIDNIHVDDGAAKVLQDHWRVTCKALGARLLLLGRAASTRAEFPGIATSLQMRAGMGEMAGIVRYLTMKVGSPIDSVPDTALQQWAHTFGGRRASQGVDLIAFSAAAKARMLHLIKGNWQLSEQDAVLAVNHHYLRSLQAAETRSNLLRLAALADMEFPIPPRVLPYPTAGFDRVCIDKGLVVLRGSSFSLAHPALGRLLCAAAATDVCQERLLAAERSAVLNARMLGPGRFPHERGDLLRQLTSSLADGHWLSSCDRLQDIASVVSVGVRVAAAKPEQLDGVLERSKRVDELVRGTRSLETFTSVAGRLRARGVVRTAESILDVAHPDTGPTLVDCLMQSSNGPVLAMLKNLADPEVVLQSLDRRRWERSRATVPVDAASITSQLVRFFDAHGASQLAEAPARDFLQRFELSNLVNSDLGDISNIVRHARADVSTLNAFLSKLLAVGWLQRAYMATALGQLCGALMSFANFLPADVRPAIRTQEISARIAQEQQQLDSPDPASVARFTCLLGGSSALWGDDFPPADWTWPETVTVEEAYYSRAPKHVEQNAPGMYELQFWLGLRWLCRTRDASALELPSALIASFLTRVAMSTPPTPQAEVLRLALTEWLRNTSAAAGGSSPSSDERPKKLKIGDLQPDFRS